MVGPIRTFFEFAQKVTRALVSARKAIALFEQAPPWREPAEPRPLPDEGDLVDDATGFVARPGRLTIVVSAVPESSAALADRLGRYLPADAEPVAIDDDGELKGRAARRSRAERQAERERDRRARRGARPPAVGGPARRRRPGASAALDDVRRRIVVSDTGSQLFAGTLQDAIDPHGALTREQAEETIRIANAEDVYDALPGGWQGVLDERGRGLSGGQRQRVVLARALATDAPILVLVEPTSAVDAHTEARIAERVAEHRRGRTTVVATVSPLWLHHADEIALLQDGRVVVHRQPRGAAGHRRRLPPRRHPRPGRADRPRPTRQTGTPRSRTGRPRTGSRAMSDLVAPDLLATSAETWRDRSLDPPTIPAELVPPPSDAPIGERLRALHRRHVHP